MNSGYRCPVLNKAVGGVPTSQHQKGEAADLTVGSPELNQQLFDLIAKGDFDFDQLIDESNYGWVHISYSAGKNRHKILHPFDRPYRYGSGYVVNIEICPGVAFRHHPGHGGCQTGLSASTGQQLPVHR